MRLLFATFEGGGHVPAPMLVAQALRRQGHEVLIVSDRCNAAAAAEKGLPFRPWDRAPDRGALGQADSGLDDWRTRWPPASRTLWAPCAWTLASAWRMPWQR
jgi:UDP:flavonoid glycosyltransferase YjiC (YdhE family)